LILCVSRSLVFAAICAISHGYVFFALNRQFYSAVLVSKNILS